MTSFPVYLAETTVPWTTIIWAAVVIFFLVLFRAPIGRFLGNLSKVKVKADKSGVEVSFDADKAQAELERAIKSKPDTALTFRAPDAEEIAETVQRAAPRREAKRFARSEVLWVDDRPDNNIHERKAFEAIGLRFTLARSTEEALGILKDRSFAAIISDMGRPPDPRAGYTLLDTLRGQGDATPFIIYAGSRSAAHREETERHGGQGCTNHPQELFALVTKAIIERPDA